MCVCVKTSENSNIYILGIILPIELKFGVHLKQTQPILWYHFRGNSLKDWDFMTIGIFWKMSVTASAAENFKRSR